MGKHSGLLTGERVYLRPLNREDAEVYYHMFFGEETRRLTGTQKHINKEQISAYIDRKAGDDSGVLLLIALKENDEVIGDIAIQDMDRGNRTANLRLAIGEERHQNRGYGREALLLMLEYGFGILNLHRIELEVYTFNSRAEHVYESVGFVREGVRRQTLFYNHEYHDVVMMSMLEHEYRERYVQQRSK
ncbi:MULTISPECIES: GNAT family protein [unclassified Paenibacillus]|uniref:GNAT family N-acetyltransferase n=1 Tax=unclassified Paenibacillus TaxID=185978 RepID=UPI002404F027|nr:MULTISPECIES: GNAT family protein [unclassified Paenibacillus]MDF9847429.1 RimJ/RimL family protein N-acetyltransferase [Paenibacillus sp. PastM-2]MDF9853994.1 RimJ/RimL family protein N-acetyltransferase [Paenibacillus sp. PastF-1]MDH6506998.1 RimJ/RimL family protein N-acetyltransferase [Paenibacillus sp. PastM-3]